MRLFRALIVRLGALVGFGRSDRDIDDELRAHRALLEDEYRRSGFDPAEARRRAAIDFGNVASVADAYRDRRDPIFLEHWRRDLVYAARSLRRSPALVLSAALVLGLGIGLSTAAATVFHSVVWQGLHVSEPERIVKVSLQFSGEYSRHVSGPHDGFSYPELLAYREASRMLAGVAGIDEERVTWQRDSSIESVAAGLVTADYFQTLGVRPARGRLLSSGDSRQPVAVVGHGFWQRALESSDDAIGRSLVLDRTSYVIVGVAEPGFGGTGSPVDVWLPLEAASTFRNNASALSETNFSWLEVVGRLAPGASIQTATVESTVIASQFDRDNPGRRTAVHIERASRLPAGMWSSSDRTLLLGASGVIAVLVAVLLLICGSNVASLLLSRAVSRHKEIAVRVALGASRRRITQQLAAEVLLLAIASAIVGVVVCTSAFHVAAIWFPIGDLVGTLNPDARILFVALAFSVGVLLVFGLMPLRQTTDVDCLPALKGEGMIGAIRVPTLRLRRALISIQVALSLILLVMAGLLSRSLERAFTVDPGYPTKGLYLAELDRASTGGALSTVGGPAFAREVRDALATKPGVAVAGLTAVAPFRGTGVATARAAGMREPIQVRCNNVDEGYFRALGIPLVAGRFASSREVDAVVVNVSFARRFWGGEQDAIGQPVEVPGISFEAPRASENSAFRFEGPRSVRVVGVIGPVQTTEIGVPDQPTYYMPIAETDVPRNLVIRAAEQAQAARIVLDTVRVLDPRAMITVRSMDDQLSEVTTPSRIGAAIAAFIGMMAVLVAAVGLHGVVAYSVIARTREIGIRLALGTPKAALLRVVAGAGLKSVGMGALIGAAIVTAIAVGLSSQMRTALFGLNPLDPVACLVAVVSLAAVVCAAVYLPARRALGMSPLDALRHDA